MDATNDPRTQRAHRPRVLKGASILTTIDVSAVSCTIRNMHANGAELKVDPQAHVPDVFLLYVAADQLCYRCEKRWRKGDRIGVRISGTEPKPRWHY